MVKVKVRSYASPSVILLAFDWPSGKDHDDFLGFAIQRKPGFYGQQKSWLPNRIGFDGPAKQGIDLPSNKSPIQKFMWWDARIDDSQTGKTLAYTIMPVCGTKDDPQTITDAAASVQITVPAHVVNGIGTYFNRAVVSSQAFSKKFANLTDTNRIKALQWLANGLEKVIPNFISDADSCEGAIYHLSDKEWIIPAFVNYDRGLSIVHHQSDGDDANNYAIQHLGSEPLVQLIPRSNSNIMHNKFLIKHIQGKPSAVLAGSANFTTGGLATQANVLHTFASPDLAELYQERKSLLAANDPTISAIAKNAKWSEPVTLGNAKIRVFFSPEPTKSRDSIDQIVESVNNATKSILFCIFTPTDEKLRNAIFSAANNGKTMFGLINSISEPSKKDPSGKAKTEIYHRSKNNRDVYGHTLYAKSSSPEGFWWENTTLPGSKEKFPVYIHHKFIIIDAETDHPIIYTGSANMSENSLHKNDENLLEIKNSSDLAQTYVAEFFRLYEHYRARSVWNKWKKGKKIYELAKDKSWSRNYYKRGTPEYKSRVNMAIK